MDPSAPTRHALRVLRLIAPSACATVRGGLTDREVALLTQMRSLKETLRQAPPGERPALTRALESLRALREEARRERMALLGHLPEEPPPAEPPSNAPPAPGPSTP
ncbi:MAG: hypothetical protein ACOYXN_07475 [Acidobacteriota bacterium]